MWHIRPQEQWSKVDNLTWARHELQRALRNAAGAGDIATVTELLSEFVVGERVTLKDGRGEGTVKYVGTVGVGEEEVVGVELDGPNGDNNGAIAGMAHLACKPLHGILSGTAGLRKKLPYAHGPDGETALHAAAQHGHAAATQLLLDSVLDPGVLCFLQKGHDGNGTGKTALHCAAEHAHADVLTILLRAVGDVDTCMHITDKFGYTALHYAARTNDASLIFKLVADSSDVDGLLVKQTRDGKTALHCAAESRHLDTAVALLSVGNDLQRFLHITDSIGYSALHYAARAHDAALVLKLFEHASDVAGLLFKQAYHGETALHVVVATTCVSMKGGYPENSKQVWGCQCYEGSLACVCHQWGSLWMQRGCTCQARSLACMCPGRRSSTIKALLSVAQERGSILAVHDNSGDTVLHHAARLGCATTVCELLQAAPDQESFCLQINPLYGCTALHFAVTFTKPAVVRSLLDTAVQGKFVGRLMNVRDVFGCSSKDLARNPSDRDSDDLRQDCLAVHDALDQIPMIMLSISITDQNNDEITLTCHTLSGNAAAVVQASLSSHVSSSFGLIAQRANIPPEYLVLLTPSGQTVKLHGDEMAQKVDAFFGVSMLKAPVATGHSTDKALPMEFASLFGKRVRVRFLDKQCSEDKVVEGHLRAAQGRRSVKLISDDGAVSLIERANIFEVHEVAGSVLALHRQKSIPVGQLGAEKDNNVENREGKIKQDSLTKGLKHSHGLR